MESAVDFSSRLADDERESLVSHRVPISLCFRYEQSLRFGGAEQLLWFGAALDGPGASLAKLTAFVGAVAVCRLRWNTEERRTAFARQPVHGERRCP